MNNTKRLQKKRSNWYLFWVHAREKLRKKTYFQHMIHIFSQEVKNIAKIFCTYFESNKLKNETRGLATNVTTGYNVLWRFHLLVMWEITIFVIVESSYGFTNFRIRSKGISKVVFKSVQCFLSFFGCRNIIDISKVIWNKVDLQTI